MEKYYEVRRRLRQGCVVSTYLFSILFDRGVREVNEKVTGRGMKLKNGNGRE